MSNKYAWDSKTKIHIALENGDQQKSFEIGRVEKGETTANACGVQTKLTKAWWSPSLDDNDMDVTCL